MVKGGMARVTVKSVQTGFRLCARLWKTVARAKFMGRGTPEERHIDWRQLIHYIGPTKSLPISLLSRRYPYYSAESPSLLLTPDSENLFRLYRLANRLKMYSPDYFHQKQALPWIQDRYEGLWRPIRTYLRIISITIMHSMPDESTHLLHIKPIVSSSCMTLSPIAKYSDTASSPNPKKVKKRMEYIIGA